MATLSRFLGYLERDKVDELRLETGAPVVLRVGGRSRAVTKKPTTTSQIRGLLRGTPLELLVPEGESVGSPQPIEMDGKRYMVAISQTGKQLEVRVSRPSKKSSDRVEKATVRAQPPEESSLRAKQTAPPTRSRRKAPTAPKVRGSKRPAATEPAEEQVRTGVTKRPSRKRATEKPSARSPRPKPHADVVVEVPPLVVAEVPSVAVAEVPSLVPAHPARPKIPDAPKPRRSKRPATITTSIAVAFKPASKPEPTKQRRSHRPAKVSAAEELRAILVEPDAVDSSATEDLRPVVVQRPDPKTSSDDDLRPVPVGRLKAKPAAAGPLRPKPTAASTATGGLDGYRLQLAALLHEARAANASDVHIVADGPARFRIAGELQKRGDLFSGKTVALMLEPLLSGRHQRQLEERGYADLALDTREAGRIRLNVCRHRGGLKGCFRLIASAPSTLEELGLPKSLASVTEFHRGLVLITGPRGHGKTTTMAALVNLFNRTKPMHIITVEDPVEVVHPVKRALVTQREVATNTHSYQSGLRAALREDPDVIAIGELGDRETAVMALSAVETGHLVMATMSTPSGARAVGRLIDLFPPEDQPPVRATLAGALKLVIGQRLVPTVDGQRLVAAVEIIKGCMPLWGLIRDDQLFQLPNMLRRKPSGMISLEASLLDLVKKGEISEHAALTYADDPRVMETEATESVEDEEPPSSQQRSAREVTAAARLGSLRRMLSGKT